MMRFALTKKGRDTVKRILRVLPAEKQRRKLNRTTRTTRS